MDKRVLIGVISEKLEIIQEQFSIIKDYDGKIPVIEIDLLMSNIRDLYELFVTLQQETSGLPSTKPETASGKSSAVMAPSILGFEPMIEPEEPSVISSEPTWHPEPEPEPRNQEPETSSPEPEPEIRNQEPETSNPEQETKNKKQETTIPDPHHIQPETRPQRTTFDLFSEGSPGTLADRFKENPEKRVADKLSENKIVDLRSTIGINDKFLFINELFDGNMRIYDEAVGKLNDCLTLAQADLLLLDLKIVYNWDGESPTVKKFVELVRRKF